MIDITLIRENKELVKENIKKKFQDNKLSLVDKVAKLDAVWRKDKKAVDDLRSKRNKISEKINQLMKQKRASEAKKLIKEAKKIPEELEKLEAIAKKSKEKIDAIMIQIPQMMHPSVPQGKGEEDNIELEKIGAPYIIGN